MFKLKVRGVPNTLTEEEFAALGEHSDLYSGSDIKILSNEALFMPIRKCQNATRFIKAADGYYSPCSPSDPNGMEMNMYDVQNGMLREPPVCFDDYMQALTKIKPSVCIDDLKRYEVYTAQFG